MGRMTNCPWIDVRELDDLAARFPGLERASIERVLEACWPMRSEVEQVLATLAAAQNL